MSLVSYSAIPGQRADDPAALAVLNEALGIGESLRNNEVIAAALANLVIVVPMQRAIWILRSLRSPR